MIAALISSYVAYLDKVPFSEISMILFSLTRLSPIVGKLLQGKTIIVGFIPAYQQIEKLRSNALLLKEVHGNVQFTQFKSGIEFDRVTYSYPNRKPALNTVSLKIPKGQTIALVGKSGSGKTTIIDLLLGFYAQDEGRILLDGKELELYDLNSFRGQVGYVPQEPQLFNTSINENLLWSFPEASETDVWNACRIANAEEFVRELPEQLDTKLGDRGVRLSGGQKQRLALARAIIRKPKLLILDEATSALDSESEGLIKKSLDTLSGKMTILIIAHRLSTIRNADYMYVIEDGLIVESGKYRKLTENADSYFSKMVAEQAL
jgi:ATP-binding cassette subfamily B protein